MRLRAALAGLLLASNAGAQSTPSQQRARPRSLAEDLQLFSQVLNQIRVNHPDSVDTHELLMSAIEGMVQAADPHSYVIPAARLDSGRRALWLNGQLSDVLIDFRYVEGAPLVAAIVPGSKAAKQDILVGDELIEIDSAPVAAGSAGELAYMLSGKKGTAVTLRFERRRPDGSIVQLDRQVERERAEELSPIAAPLMLDSVTGYVRVTTFVGDHVADELNKAVESLEGRHMQRLVLDLRDNGGGRVDQAAEIAGAFLPRGAVVYTIDSPKNDLVDTGRVSRSFWKSERRYPVVVLVNSGTASASELVAGALQDNDRATLVGQTTFGKALVMRTVPLSDGSLMAIVTGRVSTPCGRVVQRAYHGFTQRHYLRGAGVLADTAGRPSCRTAGGRTLYGGGGVVPDVILPARRVPDWLSRLGESGVLLPWAGGYAAAHTAQLTSVDAFATMQLPAAAIADLRTVAAARDVVIPADAETTDRLETIARRWVAYARWGEDGYYRIAARTDPEIAAAVRAFH